MSCQVSIFSRRRYGLARACRIWEVARSGLYAWRARAERTVSHLRRRPGPQGPCSDEELVTYARQALQESPFHGEGYRKVWARLRFKGIRTSKERVRRLMREHGLQAPHRVGRRRGSVAHDGMITTKKPNEMWGTDMTATVTTDEGQAAVMIAVDHCSFECVGIHLRSLPTASRRWSRFARRWLSDLVGLLPVRVRGWPSATITVPPISRTPSRTSWRSWGSKARRPSYASRRATAAPSDSSASSRRTCCGSGPSLTSRSFARRSTSSRTDTIASGSSSVMTT